MNIENHAKIIKIDMQEPDRSLPSADMTTTRISQAMELRVAKDPIVGQSIEAVIIANDPTTALLFKLETPLPTKPDKDNILNGDPSSVILNADFVQRLMRTFVGSDITIPVWHGDHEHSGFKEGLRRALDAAKNQNDNFGHNEVSSDDITNMLDSYGQYNFTERGNKYFRLEDILFLPVTNTDIDHKANDFEAFGPELQSTIRAALAQLSFKTYLRIILLDRTEFVLWYDKNQLIIMGRYHV